MFQHVNAYTFTGIVLESVREYSHDRVAANASRRLIEPWSSGVGRHRFAILRDADVFALSPSEVDP